MSRSRKRVPGSKGLDGEPDIRLGKRRRRFADRLAIKMDSEAEPIGDHGLLNADVWKGWSREDDPRHYRK